MAIAPAGDDSEHDFLIGLAYLEGIDVENDNEKAVELITGAAEAGLSEALRKIMDMYRNGQGVERDYVKALEWHEKLLEQFRENWEKDKSEKTENLLMIELQKFGDECMALGRLDQAKDSYNEMLDISSEAVENGRRESRRDLSVSFERIGYIKEICSDLEGAMDSYEESLRIAKELSEETGMIDSLRNLSISYSNVGDIQQARGDLEGARASYEESLKIRKALCEETGMIEDHRNLSISYKNVGGIQEARGDLEGAMSCYEEGLKIRKSLCEETGMIEDRRNLSISYKNVGGIQEERGDFERARTSYEESLRIDKELSEETGTIESKCDLVLGYSNLGTLDSDNHQNNYILTAYKLITEFAEEYPRIDRFKEIKNAIELYLSE